MNTATKITTALCVAACLAGCGKKDSKDLAEQVKLEMQRDLPKQFLYTGLKIENVTLIHKGDINYDGVAKGSLNEAPVEFEVKCECDGASVLWKAEPVGDNGLTLFGNQSGRYLHTKFDENWPKVKSELKQKYEAATRKSSEWYGKAKESAMAKYNELRAKFGKQEVPVSTNDVIISCEAFDLAVKTNDYKTCFAVARSFAKEKQGVNLAIESYRVAFEVMVKANPSVPVAHEFLVSLADAAACAYDIEGKKTAAEELRKAQSIFEIGKPEEDVKAAYRTMMDFRMKEGLFKE